MFNNPQPPGLQESLASRQGRQMGKQIHRLTSECNKCCEDNINIGYNDRDLWRVVCNLGWVFREGFAGGAASEPKPE